MGGEIAEVPITVLVVDPFTETRTRWAAALNADDQFQVIGTAAGAQDAVDRTLELVPDSVVLGLGHTEDRDAAQNKAAENGTVLCRTIRRMAPAITIVVVSSPATHDAAYQCLLSGATSVITPEAADAALTEAVRGAAHGETLLPPIIAARVRDDLTAYGSRHVGELAPQLTATEKEVLRMLAEDAEPIEVAEAYEVTERLVNLHAGYAVTKLQRYSLENLRIDLNGNGVARAESKHDSAPEASAV